MENIINVTVIWRGNKYVVEMRSDASLKDFGDELQKLTDIKEDTMKLIVPQVKNKSSKLLYPFSNEHSLLSLEEAAIAEGKSIRMMGVSADEVEKVLQSAKINRRIAGFDEEKKRMRQRISGRPDTMIKLPPGPYIFCDFRTLELPGIELNPPASKALRLMHLLAADPGITAIMNKHRWRVGIMTEMAPVGYVGVSAKCILGFNKNHGEEISLRLRTDDLKGFRKYESIKKTLLHELAHMVFSEHDENFYALDKQLNQEANNLDWTKSKGHTLSGVRHQDYYDEDFDVADDASFSQKLGGNALDPLASARESSVVAAYGRLANIASNSSDALEVDQEPDTDDSILTMNDKENVDTEIQEKTEHDYYVMGIKNKGEPDPDDSQGNINQYEPDPDETQDFHPKVTGILNKYETDPIDLKGYHLQLPGTLNKYEPDPDDSQGNNLKMQGVQNKNEPYSVDTQDNDFVKSENKCEPDPDDSLGRQKGDLDTFNGGSQLTKGLLDEPDPDEAEHKNLEVENLESKDYSIEAFKESDRDDAILPSQESSNANMQLDEPDPDDHELERIQDPVNVVCGRLQKAIETLQAELNPTDATMTLQTLFKIIWNVIDHPDAIKFKRLRKANPTIQKNVVNCKAAMEILQMVGFSDDIVFDELGRSETYLVLKRNDPGLLWLAKSFIESAIS